MIRLHDTMAREKRDFVPAAPDRVTMYACGPTVYSRAHIGNARPAVVFDLLARLIEHVHPERALRYVAPVGQKGSWVQQAMGVVKPFLGKAAG